MGVATEENTFLDNDGLSDDDVPEEAHKNLLNAVSQLYKKQRIEVPKRREPAQEISEFNLSSNIEAQSNNLHVNQLLHDFHEKLSHKEINKKVKEAKNKSRTLPKPLEKNEAEKIYRAVGYENVKKKLNKWNTIVERNRLASQLTFPLQQKPIQKEAPNFLTTFQKPTELEKAMAAVLNQSQVAQEERKLEDDLSKLSIEEMIERRSMIAKMKARESYRIAKAVRQNKIKSKKYHRILKKERIKQELQNFEKLQKTDPEAALEKLEQIERARAEERISLRHRNTGKWAKSQAIRAKYDTEARIQLAEQLAKSRELTRKTKVNDSSSSEGEADDEDPVFREDNEDENHDIHKPLGSGESGNPWLNEYKRFLEGYSHFSKEIVSELPTEEESGANTKSTEENMSTTSNTEHEKHSSLSSINLSNSTNKDNLLNKENIGNDNSEKSKAVSISECILTPSIDKNSSNHCVESSISSSDTICTIEEEDPAISSPKHVSSQLLPKENVTADNDSLDTIKSNSIEVETEKMTPVKISPKKIVRLEKSRKTTLESNIVSPQVKMELAFDLKDNVPLAPKSNKLISESCEVETEKVLPKEKTPTFIKTNKRSPRQLSPKKTVLTNSIEDLNELSDSPKKPILSTSTKDLNHQGNSSNKSVLSTSLQNSNKLSDLMLKKRKINEIPQKISQLQNLVDRSSNEIYSEQETDDSFKDSEVKLSKDKLHKIKTVVTNSGAWNVVEEKCNKSGRRKSVTKNKSKQKKQEKNLNDLFDEAEEAIQNHSLYLAKKLEVDIKEAVEEKRKNNFTNEGNEPPKKQIRMQGLDEALMEIHEDGISSGVNDLKQLKDKLNATAVENTKEPQIDPNKHINVKAQKLFSEIGDIVEEGDVSEDDDENTQKMHLIEAFADDDIAEEFSKEKKEESKKNDAESINLHLPGWGSWGGTSIQQNTKNRRKQRRFIIKLPKIPRKDEKKPTVIINEDSVPKLRQQLVNELPYPFTSVKDYEASIRAPIGKNWVPEKAFKKLIAPPVRTRMGTIIEPMSDDKVAVLSRRKRKNT